jgi:hypothetical protein
MTNHPMFATTRRNGAIQATVVRGGVIEHPETGRWVVCCLLRGDTLKLRNLRRDPRATVLFRNGTDWVTVEGRVTLIGPLDPREGYDEERQRLLRRAVWYAAGGRPKDWDEWDKQMAGEIRSVMFLEMERVYSNESWTES